MSASPSAQPDAESPRVVLPTVSELVKALLHRLEDEDGNLTTVVWGRVHDAAWDIIAPLLTRCREAEERAALMEIKYEDMRGQRNIAQDQLARRSAAPAPKADEETAIKLSLVNRWAERVRRDHGIDGWALLRSEADSGPTVPWETLRAEMLARAAAAPLPPAGGAEGEALRIPETKENAVTSTPPSPSLPPLPTAGELIGDILHRLKDEHGNLTTVIWSRVHDAAWDIVAPLLSRLERAEKRAAEVEAQRPVSDSVQSQGPLGRPLADPAPEKYDLKARTTEADRAKLRAEVAGAMRSARRAGCHDSRMAGLSHHAVEDLLADFDAVGGALLHLVGLVEVHKRHLSQVESRKNVEVLIERARSALSLWQSIPAGRAGPARGPATATAEASQSATPPPARTVRVPASGRMDSLEARVGRLEEEALEIRALVTPSDPGCLAVPLPTQEPEGEVPATEVSDAS